MSGKRRAKPNRPATRGSESVASRVELLRGGAWFRLAPFAVLAVVIMAVYGRAIGFGMLDWDDNVNVYENPAIITPTWREFVGIWTRPYADLYIPLIYTSYLIDKGIASVVGLILGAGPGQVYAGILHFVNLMIHVGASSLVFLILRRLIDSSAGALAGALLFAVHPLQVEPVVWVTGRKDVLSGMLSLAALFVFMVNLEKPSRRLACWASLFYALALLSKPSGIVTPMLALAVALFLRAPLRRWVMLVGAWLVVAVLWVAVTQAVQTRAQQTDADFIVALWKRPFVAADSLLFYVRKTLWPVGLGPIYPRSNKTIFLSPLVWLTLPVVVGAAIGVRFLPRFVALGAVLFVIPLVPVLGMVPFAFQSLSNVADRYAYLGFLGIGLMVALCTQWLSDRPARMRGGMALLSVVFVACGILSFRQTGIWRDPVTFWHCELALDPVNTSALYNLASTEREQGNSGKALAMMERIIETDPEFDRAFTGVMILANDVGDRARAVAMAERALRQLKPDHVEAIVAHGTAYLQLERYADAARAFEMATVLDPSDADAYASWGTACLKLNEDEKAVLLLKKAIALSETHPAANASLGLALLRLGRPEEAAEQLKIALRKNPNDQLSRDRLRAIERGAGRQPISRPGQSGALSPRS